MAVSVEREKQPVAIIGKDVLEIKHVGDITKLNGATLEPVDCICGGSPCQDLSVAGKRAGLAGERSGLFMEQIRVIKEMRQHDIDNGADPEDARPRFGVWENVPGAFSSNGGLDFKAVLEEFIRVAEPDAPDLPMPAKGWPHTGCYYDELGGWSVAWRVHDAQFWGVPQRRKRIALVADFGGLAAPEVLFERESVSGDPHADGEEGEETARGVGEGVEGADTPRGAGLTCGNPWDTQSERVYQGDGAWHSLSSNSSGGQSRDAVVTPELAQTLTARHDSSPQPDIGSGQNVVVQETPVFCLQGNGIDRALTAGCNGAGWRENESYTLNTIDRPAVAYSFDSLASNSMKSKNPNSGCRAVQICKTLDTTNPDPTKNQGGIAILAFAQNQRDEVRDLNDCAGALAAEPGMKQQTYVMTTERERA